MREHEVPTHVQAEDRVLLWFTFPQIVAITAVSALSYGAYSYAPGPSEMRMALAAVIGPRGNRDGRGEDWRKAAAAGGRRPAQVPAGGPVLRRVSGPAGAERAARAGRERTRPDQPDGETGGARPAQGAGHGEGGVYRRMRREPQTGETDGLRSVRTAGSASAAEPMRRRTDNVNGRQAAGRDGKEKRRNGQRRKGGRFLSALLGASALALLLVAVPATAVADGHDPEGGWTSPEIEFQPPEPVPGRRIFVERLHVSGDSAAVTLRAATGLDLRVRAFGGQTGLALRFWGSARLAEGAADRLLAPPERPCSGPSPSRGRTSWGRREPSP